MEEPGIAMKYSRVAWLALSVTIAGTLLAMAQNAPATAPQAYRPGLGDLMTMTVQPRHIKLGLAGQEKNWPYANTSCMSWRSLSGASCVPGRSSRGCRSTA